MQWAANYCYEELFYRQYVELDSEAIYSTAKFML
jgi:hypothetical protein